MDITTVCVQIDNCFCEPFSCRYMIKNVMGRGGSNKRCFKWGGEGSLTLSGPAFSVVRQARVGSEAQMPKIKVNINQLKWNLAWVIMAIKAFLMQNLSLIALLVLEIWRHKISLGIREWVMKFGYLPPENGFNFKKWGLMSRIVLLDPKLTPMSILAIFKHRKNFSFSKFLGRLDEKRTAAPPWLTNFAEMWPKGVSRIKTKSHQVWAP